MNGEGRKRIGKRMEYLSKRIKKIGFSVKLYIFLFLLGVVGVTCLQVVQMKNLEENQRQNVLSGVQNDLSQINIFIDNYLVNCRYMLMNLLTREDLVSVKDADRADKLSGICKTSSMIQNIFVKDQAGEIVSSHQVTYQVVGNKNMEKLLDDAGKRRNVIRYSEPYFSPMASSNTVAAAITSEDGKITVGVELNLEYLYNTVRQTLMKNKISFMVASGKNEIFMFDRSDGKILPEAGEYPVQVSQVYRRLAADEYPRYQLIKPEGLNAQYMMFTDNNEWGWKIYIFMEQGLLDGNLSEIYMGFYQSTLIWILVLAALFFIIISRFTKRLRVLAGSMERVDSPEDLVEIRIDKEDEIGRLSRSYNQLIVKIRQLLEEVRDSERKKTRYEIRMLQSQIGPHFLYNTLVCIKSLLKQNRVEDAKNSLHALSSLLSYSFDKKAEYVTIEEEIKELKSYIYIAKMRFGDFFEWKIDVEAQDQNSMIPKLTLQPIVENAIFHGLLSKEEGRGFLLIQVRKEQGDLLIRICDNGVGMSQQKCAQVLEGKTNKVGERLTSIGISNVHERLRLIYGQNYGISICSSPGKGTKMELRLKDRSMEEVEWME